MSTSYICDLVSFLVYNYYFSFLCNKVVHVAYKIENTKRNVKENNKLELKKR